MEKEKTWSYKDFQILEGLKPVGSHFQYFFVVSEKGAKKCNYCVWIDDDSLGRFDPSKGFETIVSSEREAWTQWVRSKIDQGDFRNRVLKLETSGQKEIDLGSEGEKLTPA
jgi:hypothetical protein